MQQGFPKVPGGRTGIMAVAYAVQREIDERDSDPSRTRPIAEILLTYDMSHVKLPMGELDVLWRFVMGGSTYANALPQFMNGEIERPRASTLFCQFWRLAHEREGYNKKHWTLLRQQIFLHGVML